MALASSHLRTLKSLFNAYEWKEDEHLNERMPHSSATKIESNYRGPREGRGSDVGVANILSLSALGGDKMARSASHPFSLSLHGSMRPPLSTVLLQARHGPLGSSRASCVFSLF